MAVAVTAFGMLAFMTLLLMHLNPDALVLKIHKTPTLLVLLTANAGIWSLYGLLQDETYPIFYAFLFTFAYDVGHIYALYKNSTGKDYLRKIIGGASVVLVVAALYACAGGYGYAGQTRSQVHQALGYVGMLSMIVLLWSPVQTITVACKTRSNASIPIGAVAASFVNSVVWTIFSLLTLDWFFFVPSSSALILNAIQIVLYWAFCSSHDYVPLV